MKKQLSILVALILIVSLSACSSSKTTDDLYSSEPSTKGTFTVGFDQDFPPMGFVGDDGEFTGFDLELAAEVAKRMDLELVLQPISWDAKDMELSAKNIDCVWNGFTINGREETYTWTDAYMANRQVFVVKANANINTLEELAGKVVSVQADSSAEAALSEVPELVASFADYLKAADYNTALMDLESGAVDSVVMDEIVARYQNEKRGGKFAVLEEALAAESYGVGFLLGNDTLRDQVQTAMEAMAADGTMKEISMKWFGEDVTTIAK